MTNDIFCVGLTRTELQTLGVLLPITFQIISVSPEELDHAAVVRVIDQARCIILNPKRLSVDLLDDFLRGQDYQRWNNAPVPIILFSDTMTKEQRRGVFIPEYPILSVDLHERFDRNRNLAVRRQELPFRLRGNSVFRSAHQQVQKTEFSGSPRDR